MAPDGLGATNWRAPDGLGAIVTRVTLVRDHGHCTSGHASPRVASASPHSSNRKNTPCLSPIYGFDIPLTDRKMYPLYAKCVELDVPVSVQVGHVLETMPSDCGLPIYLDRVACDFPELRILASHTGWPWVEELISVCYKWDNVWFGVDAWMPKYLSPPILQFVSSRGGSPGVSSLLGRHAPLAVLILPSRGWQIQESIFHA